MQHYGANKRHNYETTSVSKDPYRKCVSLLDEKHITIPEEMVNRAKNGLIKEFLDLTPKAWSIKEKINQLDFIKIKNFYSVIDASKRKVRWPYSGRKYLQISFLTKDLVLKMYKELSEVHKEKQRKCFKWAERLKHIAHQARYTEGK